MNPCLSEDSLALQRRAVSSSRNTPLKTVSPTSSFLLNPMPCDPAQPADYSELNSQAMRNQCNALNNKPDATPAPTRSAVHLLRLEQKAGL